MSVHEEADLGEDRHARIEQIFQRVEEESERRAQAAAAAEQTRAASRLSQTLPDDAASHTSGTSTSSPVAVTSARPVVGDRRRGSVSVSRFGQGSVASRNGDASRAETPTPAAAYVVNKGAFYAVQDHQHGSADSLASTAEANPVSAHSPSSPAHEEESIVQMATIAGRQSLSRAFTRGLSRSKTPSRAGLEGVLIGVSVEEATVEHHSDEGDATEEAGPSSAGAAASSLAVEGLESRAGRARAASRSVVYAGNGPPPGSPLTPGPGTSSGPAPTELKAKGSRASLPGTNGEAKTERKWLSRAKTFTRKLKRRSMMALGASR
ncbi:uncharacterized protein B0H18DRAFT_1210517 [Fomitopsis serialis]|uniref:uncharacterized protein n=1 Tax=Fomitopsis serialis TaxID=139415 RepID=UPI0020082EA1|nr:uncharacterized protein B0H18DRAFT_1124918 [Neoantrodia serialis]XP_047894427.1 uncharacterized protein B0H18DRAFT_1210514 [Neoantrodia serialis]XP_047894435.1 uncharacterized protein B0H18DRAFT_1210517 [Neoantrodia serialis]KAH9915403.1 hypothetical protein B0H18DRAFT_1124918 [Neoantrodia serialis]KAH9927784.1 hypothetical protein B0H18DRAFT_1210514 [Neoantrodia serialis]KAH9927792.1 hypothetical protein B0H18DRAFT_1210517 [Neoantrodia serialis]